MSKEVHFRCGLIDWEQREALIASGLLSQHDFWDNTDGWFVRPNEVHNKVSVDKLTQLSNVFSINIKGGRITVEAY